MNAHAFSISKQGGGPLKWSSFNVPYKIHTAGSDDINDGSDIAALKEGLNTWAAISCTKIQFNYLGGTNNTQLTAVTGSYNGQNEMAWIETTAWPHGGYVLGVTGPIFGMDGIIIESDIAFNGRQIQWSTSGQPSWSKQDVLNVAIHEEGHFLGAQHVLNPNEYSQWDPPTMMPTADPGLATRTLNDDDKKVACYLYPASGSYSCSNNSDCPNVVDQNMSTGQEFYVSYGACQGGVCSGSQTQQPSCGSGQMGDVCFKNDDCDCDYYCQDTGTGKICTELCSTNNDTCPPDFECVGFNPAASTDGTCLPDVCNAVNEACEAMSDCCSQVCVSLGGSDPFLCRQACNVQSQDCPAGYECVGLGNGNSGACILGEGTPPPLAGIGDLCSENADCASNICRSLTGIDGSFFCTEACSASGDCPCDMICADTGAGGLCIPGVNPSCAPPTNNDTQTRPTPDAGTPTGETGQPTDSSSGCTAGGGSGNLAGVLVAFLIGFLVIGLSRRREHDLDA